MWGLPLTMHVMTCNIILMPSRLRAELKQTKPSPRRRSEALLSVLRTAGPQLLRRERDPPDLQRTSERIG